MPALRVAIVGSGPAGFYVAEALLRARDDCRVAILERLHAPHGLVRHGVAPDHQQLKQVAAVFDRIAQDERFRFFGAVEAGRQVGVEELLAHHHAVVIATGCADDRRLGVPGESLGQVLGSGRFVGWYNGHPDHQDLRPDLAVETAVVVGHGNVALDACRMLLRDIDELRRSDMPEPVLAIMAERRIRTVHLLGRSGPGATRFTFKEFRQLVELPGVRVVAPQGVVAPRVAGDARSAPRDDAERVADWLRENACREPSPDAMNVALWFGVAPARFEGATRVEAVTLRPSANTVAPGMLAIGTTPVAIPCGLVVTCVGYACRPVPGVPLDPSTRTYRHRGGQVLDPDGRSVDRLFVAGWAKRGPSGVIGTNRADGCETAATLLERVPALAEGDIAPEGAFEAMLASRGVEPISYPQWRVLDACERRAGEALLKPREKLCSLDAARRRL